jgi:hypothetical protein
LVRHCFVKSTPENRRTDGTTFELKNRETPLDAWLKAEGNLATFMTIAGRRMTNPEVIASMMKRGKKLGSWLGVTVIRED